MMLVLLVMAVTGLVLFVERLLFLHRGQIRSTAFLDGIKKYPRPNVEESSKRGGVRRDPGAVAAVVKPHC